MAVLTILLGLAAPSLSSSFRAHHLAQAGAQVLAVTEYGRDEAVSQGVPMVIWLNAATGEYGVNAKPGFPGDATRDKRYSLGSELHFDSAASAAPSGDQLNAAEFSPDGTLTPASISAVRIVDDNKASVAVTQTPDGYGYELGKETR